MGRTARKRQKRKHSNYRLCNHEPEWVSFNMWLAKEGLVRKKSLKLAHFEDSGRGILTKVKIQSGEEVLNMPLNLTVNVTTVLADTTFLSLFLNNELDVKKKFFCTLSFQAILALYLIYLKFQSSTKWSIYIQSLPKEYTVPYFLPDDVLSYLDESITLILTKQKDEINSSYAYLNKILLNTKSKYKEVLSLISNFSLPVYEWAYFAINTRCVYMDLSEVCDFSKCDNVILSILLDKPNISLCPYLDLINHSPKAANESKLLVSKNFKYISTKEINIDIFSDVRFALYTKCNIKAYSQLFICYGDSHNLKLVTQYGFFLPFNDLDSIFFPFDHIINYFSSCGVKLSQDQISFINNHGLSKDLYIDSKGLSFNFYALLMVIKCYYKQNDMSKMIYSSTSVGCDKKTLVSAIKPLAEEKKCHLDFMIDKLESYLNKNIILKNCIGLMKTYSEMLEKFIKY